MKPISSSRRLIGIGLTASLLGTAAHAATFTWDGGGGDGNWSTATNWSTDTAPAATGDNLIFAGTANTTTNNNLVTNLATTGVGITFASGAGSFTLGGNTLTMGSGGGGGQTIIQQSSSNAQTISANINLSGGNGDRSIVFASGAGSLTLSGNINFSNDWLFPNTTAGTIILSGTNTGDGKATNAITGGTNILRAMMRNNVAGTVLTLGSDGALGNSGTGNVALGTASFRGVIANQNMTINTIGNRNLSGSTLAINAANITFDGTSNLTIGNIINHAGNRDFVVSSSGTVTVSNGYFVSADQTGRRHFNNLSGTGGMVVNGALYDTFHSGGITTNTTTTDGGATPTASVFRKAGAGTLTLNGNSSATFQGVMQIEAGTVKLGHSGALGASDGTNGKATQLMGGTLDLNGQSSGEFVRVLSNSTISNSATDAASLTTDVSLGANLVVNTTGDITATRLIAASNRSVTKLGTGTLTTNGSSHNNLTSWDIQAGTVVFANTSGLASDRGTTLNGGTLRLSGSNSNLINDGQSFTINSGTFDLNGKGEAVASIGGAAGTITNSAASTTSTLYVGGGVGGSSSATFGGVIENGAGTMNVHKEGTGTQTLSGTNTYTGTTTISNGSLALASTGSIASSQEIIVNGGNFNVSSVSGFTLGSGQTLSGSGGSITGDITVAGTLAIGSSPGTMTFDNHLTLGSLSISDFEFTDAGFGVGTFDLATAAAAGTQSVTFGGTLNLLFDSGESYLAGTSVKIFDFDSYSGSFSAVNVSGLDGSLVASFDQSTGIVSLTAIPEPAAAGLGALGLLALLRRRR
ncbi:MAG: autotransporter-associated beta strand repeat-containing protein [Akkermansiaceae bacterium]|jgi:autotransporter-associated beta strand protein|nr:autotransporter-associated beta strand repeat-containing protein [Akkermansiaceae bacterium]